MKSSNTDLSLAQQLAALPPAEYAAVTGDLSQKQIIALLHDWSFWARPKQLPPSGDWRTWLILAGRGFGKTRCGSEWVIGKAKAYPGCQIALVAATAADARDVMVDKYPSSIVQISSPDFTPVYEASKRQLSWPNGSVATLFSAEEPKRLRGPQHHFAWADELAAWRSPEDTWDMLQMGLRLPVAGDHPRCIVTTTPRPLPLIVGDGTNGRRQGLMHVESTVVTRGSTYENMSNLDRDWKRELLARYEGTRLGRQELDADILDDTPGALWTRSLIDALMVRSHPTLKRIVVAVDPSVSASGDGDEAGIVVAGIAPCSCKGKEELHGFVLDDVSGHLSPNDWASRAVTAYQTQGADRIIGEQNNGGALVETTIRTVDKHAAYKAVHASKGKRTRAEPVAALYEQRKVHHVGCFPKLEDQQCTWDPLTSAKSPDRLDALVWAITELMLDGKADSPTYQNLPALPNFGRRL